MIEQYIKMYCQENNYTILELSLKMNNSCIVVVTSNDDTVYLTATEYIRGVFFIYHYNNNGDFLKEFKKLYPANININQGGL